MTKVTPKIQCEWKGLARKLSKQYPSRNRGYATSHRRVYAVIANMYGVHLRTVYKYLSPVRIRQVYGREYKKLIRHFEDLLPQIFNNKPKLQLKEISNGIENLTGISLKKVTLEKLLLKYKNRPGDPPIVKTEIGNYRLKDSYY